MFCGALPIPIINQEKEQKINGIFSDAGLGEIIQDICQGDKVVQNLPALVEKSKSIKEKIRLGFEKQQKIGNETLTQVFK